jgi:hypothetical protein
LLLNLIEAGVRVKQLKPVEQAFGEDVEPMQLMMAIMELSRGNSESRIKSERNSAVWGEKKAEVRRSGKLITARARAKGSGMRWNGRHETRSTDPWRNQFLRCFKANLTNTVSIGDSSWRNALR